MHEIMHEKTTRVRHRDLIGVTVTLYCTCGTRCKSKAGVTGAFAAFDKHVKRAQG